MRVDDIRVGRLIWALRRRLGLRQSDLAVKSGVSQQEISLFERGHLDAAPLRKVRAVLRAVDASGELEVRWRGGALDRLLDERHAAVLGVIAALLTTEGWQVLPEVSYSVYGERGSIDLLAWHAESRTLLVVEVKSELTSLEATLRKHDEKVRLAAGIARERFGMEAQAVGRLLVLPEERTARRHVAKAAAVLDRAYPVRGREVRLWLSAPVGSLRGLLFLPGTTRGSTSRRVDPPRPHEGGRDKAA